jgi:hypothetical protein
MPIIFLIGGQVGLLDVCTCFGLYSYLPGCSADGQRAAFGTRRSAVQVRPPRLLKEWEGGREVPLAIFLVIALIITKGVILDETLFIHHYSSS